MGWWGDPRLWFVRHCGGFAGGSDALTLIPLVPESYPHNLCLGRLTSPLLMRLSDGLPDSERNKAGHY